MGKMEGRGADTGDREGELEPTSPRSPLAPYPSHPTEWKSRAAEYYGFVAWITTYALFVLYLLWALLPDTLIVRLGIEWYPSRWAVLLSVLVPITFFFFLLSPPVSSPHIRFLSSRYRSCACLLFKTKKKLDLMNLRTTIENGPSFFPRTPSFSYS